MMHGLCMLSVSMLFMFVGRTSDYRFIIAVTVRNDPMQITGLYRRRPLIMGNN